MAPLSCLSVRQPISSDGDHFAHIILAEKESRAGEFLQQLFELPRLIDLQDLVITSGSHVQLIGVGQLIARESRLRTFGTPMKEREEPAIWAQNSKQALKYGGHEGCRKIVCRVPQEDDIEVATREIEAGLHEALDVVFFARVCLALPLGLICILNYIRHVDTVT